MPPDSASGSMARLEATSAPDVHLGVLAEQDAVLVDEVDLAVGSDRAEDPAGIALEDLVQRQGVLARAG